MLFERNIILWTNTHASAVLGHMGFHKVTVKREASAKVGKSKQERLYNCGQIIKIKGLCFQPSDLGSLIFPPSGIMITPTLILRKLLQTTGYRKLQLVNQHQLRHDMHYWIFSLCGPTVGSKALILNRINENLLTRKKLLHLLIFILINSC